MTSPVVFGTQAKVAHALLAVVYVLPIVFTLPANINVVLTASLTVFAACWRTSSLEAGAEVISRKEALRFPIIGSISLMALFLAVKFLAKEWISVIITTYFCFMGVFAIADVLHDVVHAVTPANVRDKVLLDLKKVKIPLVIPEPEDIKLTVSQLISGIFGVAFTAWYATTKHYLANNGLGLAFSLEIGVILLSGLFIYDIFWVFGTPVMVTVAKGIDGPIKLLFKRTVDGVPGFGMLGLGDIVIPGIFLALMLQFDHHNHSHHRFFYAACAGYVAGLTTTIWVMNTFNAAQPALLYIVPAVLASVFVCAAVRGEMKRLWHYNHGDAKEDDVQRNGAAKDGDVSTSSHPEGKKLQ